MSNYRKEYIEYLTYFHCDRDYFECHEVGEEYWKEKATEEEKPVWLFLIKLSVSQYHHRRGNFNGAKRMLKSALNLIPNITKGLLELGLEPILLRIQLEKIYQDIYSGEEYVSTILPFKDEGLLNLCKDNAKSLNLVWGKESDLSNEMIVHKHSKRDRTDVIKEREESLKSKNKIKWIDCILLRQVFSIEDISSTERPKESDTSLWVLFS